MKKMRSWLIVCLLAVFMCTGCGAAKAEYDYNMESPREPMEDMKEEIWVEDSVESDSLSNAGTGSTGIESITSAVQKLIKTVNMDMETKDFDTLLPVNKMVCNSSNTNTSERIPCSIRLVIRSFPLIFISSHNKNDLTFGFLFLIMGNHLGQGSPNGFFV